MSYSDVQNIISHEKQILKHFQELKEKIYLKGIEVELEDEILRKFLRSRNYDIDMTANLIYNYMSLLEKKPHFFKSLSFSEKAFEANFFGFLPERNVNGEAIAVMRLGVWEPDEVSWEALMASTVHGWDYELFDEQIQMAGGIEIVDCSNVGLKQFTKMGIKEIKLICEMTDSSLPIKWRKIFVLNANIFIEKLYTLSKPFLSKQLKEQIVFVSEDLHKLHEVVPKNILPAAYGGTGNDFHAIDYYKKIKLRENDLLQLWQKCKDI